jgi:hypothetical protein
MDTIKWGNAILMLIGIIAGLAFMIAFPIAAIIIILLLIFFKS